LCGASSAGYGCYGCVGASCMLQNDVNNASDELQDALQDALKDLN